MFLMSYYSCRVLNRSKVLFKTKQQEEETLQTVLREGFEAGVVCESV
jgi:hypothetical protein